MNERVIDSETRTGERERDAGRFLGAPVELDLNAYAPLLLEAGVAPDLHERYLRQLTGEVQAILDAYFQELKGGGDHS